MTAHNNMPKIANCPQMSKQTSFLHLPYKILYPKSTRNHDKVFIVLFPRCLVVNSGEGRCIGFNTLSAIPVLQDFYVVFYYLSGPPAGTGTRL